ncbi:MAG: hypothetical protein CVV27_02810 [Candidatus Melainabacteria bacterium HGW-Melainabacteria-1]|nr:MAG: hypothetical protein CVV27_02810 [Candidatus Melainabacteria bacterium HGW-Melainabacteria-1]
MNDDERALSVKNMDKQSIQAQQAEIKFRRLLFRQQVQGEALLEDEFDTRGIEAILKQRMAQTQAVMSRLHAQQLPLGPYLELGAERGQRSLVMENALGQHGAAADISFDMLRSCSHYAQVFEQQQLPLRLCCDAQNLPLRSGSLPFVFCFQTLHHFLDFSPVIAEIHRVLAPGGCFYFDDEPFQQLAHLPLYPGPKMYSQRARQASKFKKTLDYFFASRVCNEADFGVIEEDEIPLKVWKQRLKLFQSHKLTLRSPFGIKSRFERPSLRRFFNSLVGGLISGTCYKAGKLPERFAPIEAHLICPACKHQGLQASLEPAETEYTCTCCSEAFPIQDGVLFLLDPAQRLALYPELTT